MKDDLGLLRIYKVSFGEHVNIEDALKDYVGDPDIEYAVPDDVHQLQFLPNDQLFYPEQWNLDNDGTYSGTVDSDIDAPEAWDLTTGDNQTIIAIVDTGVQTNHPDLSSKLLPGYDFADDDNDPSDELGHGTHVAGIAAAETNNGRGVAGVCPECMILPIKVSIRNTSVIPTSSIISGIVYAVDNGADVINLSMVGNHSVAYQDAILYAYTAGVVIVASSGNSFDEHIYYPAGYRQVIAVGASDSTDKRTDFSTYGYNVDVIAPGDTILSSCMVNAWCVASGTSMAAPHVAGIAGLLLSNNPTLSPDQVKWHIELGAEDQKGTPAEDTPGWDKYHGLGRINAYNSLQPISPGVTFSNGSAYADSYFKGVAPDFGDINTLFTFKAIYIDESNLAPAFVRICFGGNCYDMAADTSASSSLADGDYVNGEQYTYTTTLPQGGQGYYFFVSNGFNDYKLPQNDALIGPNFDSCPDDPDKTDPGVCGCSIPDTDTDADGTPDCIDLCIDDPPVMVDDTRQSYPGTLQSIYDDPFKVTNGYTLLLQEQTFEEALVLNREIAVALRGGHDCGFSSLPVSSSTIRSLRVVSGTVIVENIVVSP